MKRISIFSGVLFVTLLFFACSPSTIITGSWVNPDVERTGIENKKVFIASLSRNMEVRQKLESVLEKEANKRDIQVVKSVDYFTPEFYQQEPSERELVDKINDAGVDAILTISLIDEESETRYVPGANRYAPMPAFGWYGGFYNYYRHWQPMFSDPGYHVTDKTYFIESNLYSAKNDELIWSAQSETMNPGSIEQFANGYALELVRQLKKDGFL